jgi:hypothetical protein
METLTPSLLFVLYQIADVKTKTKHGFVWRLYTKPCFNKPKLFGTREKEKKRGTRFGGQSSVTKL